MNTIKTLLSALSLSIAAMTTVTAQEVVTIDNSLGTRVEFDETEGMTIRYDSLLNDWKVKMYLYEDSTCRGTDIDPTFPDSVYIDRLQRIPAVMELPYNHIVRQYIDRYTKRLRKSVSVMLGAGNFYFPIFEAELERYGLPLELKYLPVIESALKPKAVSPAGAGGLWQFMVGTGKQYGLKVSSVIDERCDPIKSSDAAARYLRDLYRIYHDWALVLAAYNCGPGNVNRAIHRAGARDYWQIYPYLPKETRGYVPAFIAATYAMTYYCEHGICPMRSRFPIATDTIVINRDISMRQISEVVGISLDVLKSLNPQYRTDRIPGKSSPCTLRMPDDMLHAFLDYGDDVYRYRANELLARRSEVSVRGERNSRTTNQRTQQPAVPAQTAMTPSEMPRIADTEAIVPPEEQTQTALTNDQSQRTTTVRNTSSGEVVEVTIEDTTKSDDDAEQGFTTISDGEDGDLRPVQTTTQRTTTSAQSSATSNQTRTTTRNYNRQQTQSQAQTSSRHNSRRQQTQQQTTTQQQAQSQGTNRNRSRQQTQQQTATQQQTQSQSTNRNRSRQQTQQQTATQQQTQSQSTNRNRSRQQTQQQTATQQQTQSQSTNRNRSRQQTQQQTATQQQAQSQSTNRNRSRQQTQHQTATQQQAQSQSTNRNRSRQQAQQQTTTQQQTQSTNRNRHQAQQQTTNQQRNQQSGGRKQTQQQATSQQRNQQSSGRKQTQQQTTQQPSTSNRGSRPTGSGKAGSRK